MASPIHRYLFSPPTSPSLDLPPVDDPKRSPALDSLANSVKDYLLPSPRAREHSSSTGGPSPKAAALAEYQRQRAIHELGPGGFNSTKPYPSRLGQPTIVVRPPQEASNAVASSSRRGSGTTTHRRLASIPINVCTSTPLTPQSFSIPLPKKVVRAIVLLSLLVASGWLLTAAVRPGATPASAPAGTIVPHWRLTDETYQPAARKYPVVSHRPRGGAPESIEYAGARRAALPPSRTQRRPAALAPQHELLALQSYFLASATHALPYAYDATRPLDAESLLGYAMDDEAIEELKREVDPVVIWAGSETWTAPIERLLDLYALDPPPRMLSLDHRGEPAQVSAVLARLVPTRDQASPLPFVVVAGQAIGGYDTLLALHQADKLQDILSASGTIVDGAKIKAEQAALHAKRMRQLKQAKIQRR